MKPCGEHVCQFGAGLEEEEEAGLPEGRDHVTSAPGFSMCQVVCIFVPDA